ncbi:MAG: hypothetical protein PVJ43_11235 [Gemmatimonadales bacterium]
MSSIRRRRLRDESGFALAMAVFALVLLAAVVAGGYFSASQEFQIGRGMRSVTTSFYSGEAGILQVLDQWDPVAYGALQPGDTQIVGPVSFEGGGSYTAFVVRVGSDSAKRYYYIEAVGRPPGANQGQRRQAAVARTWIPDLCCDAAAKVIEYVNFGGGAQPIITGLNTNPPGSWPANACSGFSGDSLPGVVLSPGGAVNDPSRVSGYPAAIVSDPTLSETTIFDFGDLTYDELAAMADIQLPDSFSFGGSQPTVVNGDCDKSSSLNWGAPSDPNSPCFDYFPIIHVNGSIDLTGSGGGQGILLVDEDLKMNGPFEFYGIVMVKDDLTLGGPVDYYGAAYVGDDMFISGATPRFWYSSCAAQRAVYLSKLGRPRLLPQRAWVELF